MTAIHFKSVEELDSKIEETRNSIERMKQYASQAQLRALRKYKERLLELKKRITP